jgi:hypothetical protein
MAPAVVTSLQVIWETRRLAKNWQGKSCLFCGCQQDGNIELCSTAKIALVKWRATNIALGQYWFLLLLHGFIPPGPGQYGVLLPWLEEDMT